MASIRTIAFGKGVEYKWNTGTLRELEFSFENVQKFWTKYVADKFHFASVDYARSAVADIVRETIKENNFSQTELLTYLVAVRATVLNFNIKTGDGACAAILTLDPDCMKITFWNLAYHFNHHCRQLWQWSFIGVSAWKNFSMNYFGGEWKDKDGLFLDYVILKDEPRRSSKKSYTKLKEEEKVEW